MPCTPFTLPGLGSGFICTRGPRPRCACGKLGAFQCDAPSKRRGGTCDKHLCASCATEVGPDRHLCPEHAASGYATVDEAPPAPVQVEMF